MVQKSGINSPVEVGSLSCPRFVIYVVVYPFIPLFTGFYTTIPGGDRRISEPSTGLVLCEITLYVPAIGMQLLLDVIVLLII